MIRIHFLALFVLLVPAVFAAEDPTHLSSGEEMPDEGFLGLEGGFGYNTYETSQYFKAPLFFTGSSAYREISTRVLLLSDAVHASDYFSGRNGFVRTAGLYHYNFGLLDIDYLSWHGKLWSAGLGGGLAHQGFLIAGANRGAHAITGRLRAQLFLFWWDYLATHAVVTVPIAFYQTATDGFRMVQAELNFLFDFHGRVKNPEPQSFMFSASLHYEFVQLSHELRSYSQHEFTPLVKVTVVY